MTSQPVPYHADTTAILIHYANRTQILSLLDSAEIGSKIALQSLILINAMLKLLA